MLDEREFDNPLRRVLIHGYLYHLCMEYSGYKRNGSERHRHLGNIYAEKLNAAVAQLRLTMRPSADAVIALTIAVRLQIPLEVRKLIGSRRRRQSSYAALSMPRV